MFLFLVSTKNHHKKPCGASPINRGPGDITWDEGAPTFGASTSHAPNKFIDGIFWQSNYLEQKDS